MSIRLLAITNGDIKSGFGHISRTKTIGKKFLNENSEVIFLVLKSSLFKKNIEDDLKVKVYDVDFFSNKLAIQNIINLNSINAILIDLVEDEYVKLSWIKKNNPNIFVATITLFLFNLSSRYEDVSFFPDIEEYPFVNSDKFILYSGPKYLVFREEFKSLKKIQKRKIDSILISMGGTDPYSLSELVINSIIKWNDYRITVLLSDLSESYERLMVLIKNNKHKKITLLKSTNSIFKEMQNHDIAFINGGLTRYEVCVAQIPFIALSIHEEQFKISEKFVNRGIGVNLGVYSAIGGIDIKNAIQYLENYRTRKEMAIKMKNLFDLNGVTRIFNVIKERLKYEENN